jgi:hypothetical protein
MFGTGKQGWAEFLSPSLFANTRLMKIEMIAQRVVANCLELFVSSGFRLREFLS